MTGQVVIEAALPIRAAFVHFCCGVLSDVCGYELWAVSYEAELWAMSYEQLVV